MNMKGDDDYDDSDPRNGYGDINNSANLDNLDIELPEGAKKGLKDATLNDSRLNTSTMGKKLDQSLP